MLSHLHRFHGHGSLRYLYQHGAQVRSNAMSLRSLTNPNRVHARFAIIVSKKVYKSAVKRNRLRRRIYEVIRQELDHIKPSLDVAVTIQDPSLLLISHTDLRRHVVELLVKAQLMR